MIQTSLGSYILRDDEIYATIGSITICNNGTRLPTKNVRRVIGECKGCTRPLTDERELPFARQTGMCFVCCTGNPLDFCPRSSGRTVLNSRVPECQRLIRRYTGERTDFTGTQPFYGNLKYTEVHWSWYPEDSFMRLGYDSFRLMHGLTKDEAEEAVNTVIYKGFAQVLVLTKPRWLKENRCCPKSTLLFL